MVVNALPSSVNRKLDILLDCIENTLHVQIHHFGKHLLWVRIELLAPGRACIGEQEINMVGRLANLCNQSVQLGHIRAVSGYRNCLGTGSLVGQGVQCCDGFIAGLLLARGDVHL